MAVTRVPVPSRLDTIPRSLVPPAPARAPCRVHYTMVMVHQVEYSLTVLGPSVTAPNFGRVEEAVKGTSSSYMLFACALFALGLFRKLLSVEYDLSGGFEWNSRVHKAGREPV